MTAFSDLTPLFILTYLPSPQPTFSVLVLFKNLTVTSTAFSSTQTFKSKNAKSCIHSQFSAFITEPVFFFFFQRWLISLTFRPQRHSSGWCHFLACWVAHWEKGISLLNDPTRLQGKAWGEGLYTSITYFTCISFTVLCWCRWWFNDLGWCR